jgi:hypothetical protein
MSQIIPIYIPTYINSAEYTPARVLPRLFFYNGLVDCQSYYIESGSLTTAGNTIQQNSFPYFDNYNVVSGSFPTTDSLSLLFNNESVTYGALPTQNLYTTYWEKYISLLYNPYTRLINCDGIIPLADYFDMELNDIVNFRGNYYHLRAINNYSLKTGECKLQLLGPILNDTFDEEPIPPVSPANALIHLAEYNASPTAFFDANIIVDGTPYYFSGDFSQSIAGGTTGDVSMQLKDGGATVWGPYTTASAQFSIYDNGTLLQSASLIVRSGSGDTDLSFPITFTAGHTFKISGSTAPQGTTTTTTSTTTTTTTTAPPTGSATLAWTFSETGGANGIMEIYVNGSIVETRYATSSGTYTVYLGNTIRVKITTSGCTGGSSKANSYCTGIINDATCETTVTELTSTLYTVVSGDVGTILHLDNFSACDTGCL